MGYDQYGENGSDARDQQPRNGVWDAGVRNAPDTWLWTSGDTWHEPGGNWGQGLEWGLS